jgi:hypothetical protein
LAGGKSVGHFTCQKNPKRIADDIDPAFATIVAKQAQALAVLSDPITFANILLPDQPPMPSDHDL